jgi:hypothetical protein
MKHFASNPRQITDKQFERLQKDLAELGDLGGYVHDLDTDEIIGGNQRAEAMGLLNGTIQPVIEKKYEKPNKQGTVMVGYFEWKGEQYKYRAVRGWDDKKRQRANIVANKAGGSWDMDALANGFDMADLLDWGFEEDELVGVDYQHPKLHESVQEIRTLPMLRVLISVPVDSALDAKPLIDKLAGIQGVEVLYGANDEKEGEG